ncbi:Tuberous sclerosis 2-like protein [Cladochytrium tenue]|nr:Tuberous sclerosis 2-like protein [Cladochytrium tenue]
MLQTSEDSIFDGLNTALAEALNRQIATDDGLRSTINSLRSAPLEVRLLAAEFVFACAEERHGHLDTSSRVRLLGILRDCAISDGDDQSHDTTLPERVLAAVRLLAPGGEDVDTLISILASWLEQWATGPATTHPRAAARACELMDLLGATFESTPVGARLDPHIVRTAVSLMRRVVSVHDDDKIRRGALVALLRGLFGGADTDTGMLIRLGDRAVMAEALACACAVVQSTSPPSAPAPSSAESALALVARILASRSASSAALLLCEMASESCSRAEAAADCEAVGALRVLCHCAWGQGGETRRFQVRDTMLLSVLAGVLDGSASAAGFHGACTLEALRGTIDFVKLKGRSIQPHECDLVLQIVSSGLHIWTTMKSRSDDGDNVVRPTLEAGIIPLLLQLSVIYTGWNTPSSHRYFKLLLEIASDLPADLALSLVQYEAADLRTCINPQILEKLVRGIYYGSHEKNVRSAVLQLIFENLEVAPADSIDRIFEIELSVIKDAARDSSFVGDILKYLASGLHLHGPKNVEILLDTISKLPSSVVKADSVMIEFYRAVFEYHSREGERKICEDAFRHVVELSCNTELPPAERMEGLKFLMSVCQVDSERLAFAKVSDNTTTTVLKANCGVEVDYYMAAVIKMLESESDLATLLVCLDDLTTQLQSMHLFAQFPKSINALRAYLCTAMSSQTFAMRNNPAATALQTAYLRALRLLSALLPYRQYFTTHEAEEAILVFERATRTHSTCARFCLDSLLICVLEFPTDMARLAPTILLNLRRDSIPPEAAPQLLELLAAFTGLRAVGAKYSPLHYRHALDLGLGYLRSSAVPHSPSPRNGADLTAADALMEAPPPSRYVAHLAHRAFTSWFRSAGLPERRKLITTITQGLGSFADDDAAELVWDELVQSAYADTVPALQLVAPPPSLPPTAAAAAAAGRSWLVGSAVVTVRKSGPDGASAELVIRRSAGVAVFSMRLANGGRRAFEDGLGAKGRAVAADAETSAAAAAFTASRSVSERDVPSVINTPMREQLSIQHSRLASAPVASDTPRQTARQDGGAHMDPSFVVLQLSSLAHSEPLLSSPPAAAPSPPQQLPLLLGGDDAVAAVAALDRIAPLDRHTIGLSRVTGGGGSSRAEGSVGTSVKTAAAWYYSCLLHGLDRPPAGGGSCAVWDDGAPQTRFVAVSAADAPHPETPAVVIAFFDNNKDAAAAAAEAAAGEAAGAPRALAVVTVSPTALAPGMQARPAAAAAEAAGDQGQSPPPLPPAFANTWFRVRTVSGTAGASRVVAAAPLAAGLDGAGRLVSGRALAGVVRAAAVVVDRALAFDQAAGGPAAAAVAGYRDRLHAIRAIRAASAGASPPATHAGLLDFTTFT